MTTAPVVLFVYKRPRHTQLTLDALRLNALAPASDLFVFSDAPRTPGDEEGVAEVRRLVREVSGFRSVSVVERERNLGLAASVIGGVGEVIGRYGRVIVVEDDLVTGRGFLTFMNEALEKYRDDARIYSVTGLNFPIVIPDDYRLPVYLSYRSSSWGWGTWRDRWEAVDWSVGDYNRFAADSVARARFNRGGDDLSDMLALQMAGKIDSWAIRWAYAHFLHDAWCLFSVRSKVQNIGCDASGTHCGPTDRYRVEVDDGAETLPDSASLQPDGRILKNFADFHRYSVLQKIGRLLRPLR